MSDDSQLNFASRSGAAAAFENLRAVGWTYLGSVVAGLPFATGLGLMVRDYVASTLDAKTFARGFDLGLVAELVVERSGELTAFSWLFLGAFVAWAILATFVSGLVYGAVSRGIGPKTPDLLADGARYFGRLFRLCFFGVPLVVLVAGGAVYGLSRLVNWIVEDWTSEPAAIVVRLGAVLVAWLVAAWTSGAYDLMKVAAVTHGEHRAHRAFMQGLRLAIRRPLGLLSVYVPYAGLALVLTLGVTLVDVRFVRDSWAAMGLGALLQQAVVVARAFLRVGRAGAEVGFVDRFR